MDKDSVLQSFSTNEDSHTTTQVDGTSYYKFFHT